jgi:homocysteine S-methyltransferase
MGFLAELEKRVILGDGATGTEFLRRGCIPGSPLDELNLSRPHFVLGLHREYVAAGAEMIKTNTFQANRLRLPEPLRGKVREINLAGAQLARDAAKGGFVAGSIGPLTDFRTEERSNAYREQCEALAEGGCDLFLLETFMELEDLSDAMSQARKTGLPVVGQMASRQLLRAIEGLDVAGVNCVSVEQALTAVDLLREKSARVSAFPSAGLPGQEISPAAFAEGIRQLVEAGARLVGGCCGAGPDHIRAAAAVVGRGR